MIFHKPVGAPKKNSNFQHSNRTISANCVKVLALKKKLHLFSTFDAKSTDSKNYTFFKFRQLCLCYHYKYKTNYPDLDHAGNT